MSEPELLSILLESRLSDMVSVTATLGAGRRVTDKGGSWLRVSRPLKVSREWMGEICERLRTGAYQTDYYRLDVEHRTIEYKPAR